MARPEYGDDAHWNSEKKLDLYLQGPHSEMLGNLTGHRHRRHGIHSLEGIHFSARRTAPTALSAGQVVESVSLDS